MVVVWKFDKSNACLFIEVRYTLHFLDVWVTCRAVWYEIIASLLDD